MFNYYLWQQYILQQQYMNLYNRLISRQDATLNISGVWNTDYYGRVIFEQEGNNIKGTFRYGNGRIEGILNGNVFNGQWSETPTFECPLHQGRVRFVFSPKGDSFIGTWGICQEPLTKEWSGFRLVDTPAINVSGEWFTTNFGKITFTQEGNKVNATYQYKNGKIEGTLKGYTLTGYWTQEPSFNCYFDKGRIEIDFSLNGEAFTGIFGNCEDEPTRVFSGIKVG